MGTGFRKRSCAKKCPRSALEADAEQEDARGIVGAGHIRMQPILLELALDLNRAVELVGQAQARRIAFVLAVHADIVVDAEPDFDGANEPAAKRMIDLQTDVARELAGNARDGRFADR